MVCDRAQRLRLGPGLDDQTEVGPLINEDARTKVERYIGVGRAEGARVLIGGERPPDKRLERGWFYRPTVLGGVRPGMRVEQEEIFGPVLSVDRKSTRLNSSHSQISYAVFCLKKKKNKQDSNRIRCSN